MIVAAAHEVFGVAYRRHIARCEGATRVNYDADDNIIALSAGRAQSIEHDAKTYHRRIEVDYARRFCLFTRASAPAGSGLSCAAAIRAIGIIDATPHADERS